MLMLFTMLEIIFAILVTLAGTLVPIITAINRNRPVWLACAIVTIPLAALAFKGFHLLLEVLA